MNFITGSENIKHSGSSLPLVIIGKSNGRGISVGTTVISEGVHKADDFYLISDRDVWRPGLYATIEAAQLALQIEDDEVLRSLQDSVNPGGVIALEMVQQAMSEQS